MSTCHNSSRRSFIKKAAVAAYVAPMIISSQAQATMGRNGSAQMGGHHREHSHGHKEHSHKQGHHAKHHAER